MGEVGRECGILATIVLRAPFALLRPPPGRRSRFQSLCIYFPRRVGVVYNLHKLPQEHSVLAKDGKQVDPQELEQAFSLFSLASEQLAGVYQDLQQQVERLTQELAIANGELKRQYLEKEALSRRLSLLLSALPAGVVVMDHNHRVLEANPAALLMLGEPLIGLPWEEIVARQLRPTSASQEWELSPKGSNTVKRISISESSLDEEGGRILLLHDVTEAHDLQEQLQRHQRLSALGEMAAKLAHQLRTPLATAVLYSSHLTRPVLAEADRLKFAEKTLARLKHLESLIQDMLLFVKGEAGSREVILISTFLQDLQQVMEPHMEQSGLTFTVMDHAANLGILGSRDALAGALINLLENAIQACKEGGHIELSAESKGSDVILTVSDTGKGIDPSLHAQLFDPFFTTRPDGTGLGLAIVRNAIQAHGGEIVVQSSPGEGSRFIIRLPAIRM